MWKFPAKPWFRLGAEPPTAKARSKGCWGRLHPAGSGSWCVCLTVWPMGNGNCSFYRENKLKYLINIDQPSYVWVCPMVLRQTKVILKRSKNWENRKIHRHIRENESHLYEFEKGWAIPRLSLASPCERSEWREWPGLVAPASFQTWSRASVLL